MRTDKPIEELQKEQPPVDAPVISLPPSTVTIKPPEKPETATVEPPFSIFDRRQKWLIVTIVSTAATCKLYLQRRCCTVFLIFP